ncbi:hypothetical protein [Actinomycetospora atypica]|uniref:Uncharacterized protein n=1 Tax=Actinomycetospora atypica TaxID=1290095 RepID=A0ABV9YJM7_9PSEU
MTLLNLVVTYPRWFFWTLVVSAGALAMAKVARLDVAFVMTSTGIVSAWFFVDFWVSTAYQTWLGYDTSQFAMSIPSLVSAVGSIGFSFAMVCLIDEGARAAAVDWVLPDGAVHAVRAVLMAVLVIAAFFPVVRSFSGTSSFTAVVAARDQVLFPGYASPGQVEDRFTVDFLRKGAPVSEIRCSYFAPNLGAPPVYNCDATLRFSDGSVVHHDNIQSTGRPDGTFSCGDYTSGVKELC